MSHNEEFVLARIRHKVQEEGIKLWNPPFYSDNSPNQEAIKVCYEHYILNLILYQVVLFQELAFNLCDVFALPPDVVVQALVTLQTHAIQKLASISQFKRTGLATLRIKVAGSFNQQTIDIQIQLTVTGEDLKNRILENAKIPINSRYVLHCNPDSTIYTVCYLD